MYFQNGLKKTGYEVNFFADSKTRHRVDAYNEFWPFNLEGHLSYNGGKLVDFQVDFMTFSKIKSIIFFQNYII